MEAEVYDELRDRLLRVAPDLAGTQAWLDGLWWRVLDDAGYTGHRPPHDGVPRLPADALALLDEVAVAVAGAVDALPKVT